jgi:hypothetical protein
MTQKRGQDWLSNLRAQRRFRLSLQKLMMGAFIPILGFHLRSPQIIRGMVRKKDDPNWGAFSLALCCSPLSNLSPVSNREHIQFILDSLGFYH